ncbi:hypothetical protein GCM10025867_19730 [Frondihabitans sucicola]|uniref:Uncharacterized protein n=1 Tax=Frondihabitans sucicola TaxID=1268041 RepID=A0ABM8GMV8_9MICO|nr:hypothetical protein GCM10025867_19730 [Frondihabitans sucicola]
MTMPRTGTSAGTVSRNPVRDRRWARGDERRTLAVAVALRLAVDSCLVRVLMVSCRFR